MTAVLGATACGDNRAAAPLDAGLVDAAPPDATPPGPVAAVFVDELDFGLADCGGSSPDVQPVRLRNNGDERLTWSALVRFSPAFVVDGPNGGTLAPGEQVDITVRAAAIPTSATAGATRTDILQITTNDPHRGPIELPLTVTAAGAVFEIAPGIADFGLAPLGSPIPDIDLAITNVGNRPAMVALTSPDVGGLSTSFDSGLEVEVAPGATLPGARAHFVPGSSNPVSGTATLDVVGPVCAGSATEVELKGQGTIGVVAISPATIDFGRTACGSDVIPRTFQVHNFGNQPLTYTATLDAGAASRFAVIPATASVAPGQYVEVKVFSEGIPAESATTENLYGEGLTLTTDIPGDAPHNIPLQQTARGAILSLSTDSLDLGRVAFGTTGVRPLVLENDGNGTVTVTPVITQGATAPFAVTWNGANQLAGGGTLEGEVAFAPTGLGSESAAVQFEVDGPLCGPLPEGVVEAQGTLSGSAEQVVIAQGINEGARGNRAGARGTVCVQATGGFVACLGDDDHGLRGDGPAVEAYATPTLVRTATGVLDDVVQLTSGVGFICGLRGNGEVWCWGSLFGVGPQRNPSTDELAVRVATGKTAIDGGYHFLCTVGAAGLDCNGGGGRHASEDDDWTIANITDVAMYASGGLALRADKKVVSFGSNNGGERGSAVASFAAPAVVPGLSNILQVAAAGSSFSRSNQISCARASGGALWCWGNGRRHGNLGRGVMSEQRSTPQKVLAGAGTPLADVTEVAVAREHSCAIAGGAVFCWGRGTEGQLGYGAVDNAFARRTIPAITNARDLAVGRARSCAVLTTGRVLCWGRALDSSGVSSTPTPIEVFEP